MYISARLRGPVAQSVRAVGLYPIGRRFESFLAHQRKIPYFKEDMPYADPLSIGIDEAGRGAWAGPIVGAAVIFKRKIRIPEIIRDSKTLSRHQREDAARFITKNAYWAIGSVSSCEIDRIGIQAANSRIFEKAFEKLSQQLQQIDRFDSSRIRLCIDGRPNRASFTILPSFIVDGDAHMPSIAAASIIAKIARDHIMRRIAGRIQGYAFERHKGYGTHEHRSLLVKRGASVVHRATYAPVREILESSERSSRTLSTDIVPVLK